MEKFDYDKAMAEQLSKTFPYLLQSELMQSMLRQEMGVSYVNGSITAQTVPNTNLFSLKVTSTDPQAAYDILNTMIEIYPRVADYVVGSTQMNLLTVPTVAEKPYNEFRPARTWRIWLYGISFIEQSFIVKLTKQPPKGLYIFIVVCNIRMVKVYKIAHCLCHFTPLGRKLHDILTTFAVIVTYGNIFLRLFIIYIRLRYA